MKMVVISLRLIICQFNNLMRLNTLCLVGSYVKKSFTTPISAFFFLTIKLKIIFSFVCGLHQYMKLVQLLHITYWITNGLGPSLATYSISKCTRYFLTAKKLPHRRLFQAAFIQVFLLPSFIIILQRGNIIYTYQFSPISFSIFFILKTITLILLSLQIQYCCIRKRNYKTRYYVLAQRVRRFVENTRSVQLQMLKVKPVLFSVAGTSSSLWHVKTPSSGTQLNHRPGRQAT